MTEQTISATQAKELAWLRACTVSKYYEQAYPSSARRFRWAWVDAAGAWSSNQYALHHVPKAVCDLTGLADERGFIRLHADSEPLNDKMKPEDAHRVFDIDSAFPLFEYELKPLKRIVATLRLGLRQDRDLGVLNLVRTSAGGIEMQVTDKPQPTITTIRQTSTGMTVTEGTPPQTRFQQFSVASPFGSTMARVEMRLSIFYLDAALSGMRSKTVQVLYQHRQGRLYLRDAHGRSAMIMCMSKTD